MKLVAFSLLAVGVVTGQYHRIEDPSTHLKVESCRDISTDIFGDPEGTCEEHGYIDACVSCMGGLTFHVRGTDTCDQMHTECYFRAANEQCLGASQCPFGNMKGDAVSAKSWYRIEPPSTHLKVESCRDISEDLFGDPEGTCEEHGYNESCLSCNGELTFHVRETGTCDQMHTECYFRAPNEQCLGTSQCPSGNMKGDVVSAKSWYRIEPPSTHLKVESCRDISEDLFGDPEGTCAEHGYNEACLSCNGELTFHVRETGTCDQMHTECYFRTPTEECFGNSQCPYSGNNTVMVRV